MLSKVGKSLLMALHMKIALAVDLSDAATLVCNVVPKSLGADHW